MRRETESRHRRYSRRRVPPFFGGGHGLRRKNDLSFACRAGYVLLETVIATGLLIVGLTVIGTQIQDSDAAIKKMERKVRAVMLAELKLAELDMGIVDLVSVDDVEEGDFGPRYPDYGWRLIFDTTGLDGVFALTLDVMHIYHEGDWKPDDFDYDAAEVVFTTHTLRAVPVPFDLELDFGLPKDQLEDVTTQLAELSIPGLDINSLNLRTLAGLDFEDFVRALPVLAEVFGFNVDDLTGILPPQLRSLLEESGLGSEDNGEGNGQQDDQGNGQAEESRSGGS